MKQNQELPPGWGGDSFQDNPWKNTPPKQPVQQPEVTQQHEKAVHEHPQNPAPLHEPVSQTEKPVNHEDKLPEKAITETVIPAVQNWAEKAKSGISAIKQEIPKPAINPEPKPKSAPQPKAKPAVFNSSDFDSELPPILNAQYDNSAANEKASVSPLIFIIPVIAAILAFLGGFLLMRAKGKTQNTAVVNTQQMTVPVTEQVEQIIETTEAAATLAETTVTTTVTTTETSVITTTAQKLPTISSAEFVGVYNDYGDGYMFRLDVKGDFSYWIASVTENTSVEPRTFTVSSKDLTADFPYVTGSSIMDDLRAVITPYDADGTAGPSFSTVWNPNRVEHDTSVPVYSCNETGIIRTYGETVPGFASSYILEGGAIAKVRQSLGDGWHIKSGRWCYSKNTTWYELYDAWDGDYYGWVAENYLLWD